MDSNCHAVMEYVHSRGLLCHFRCEGVLTWAWDYCLLREENKVYRSPLLCKHHKKHLGNDSDVLLWYHSCPYLFQNTWIELLNGVFVLICTQTLAGGRAGRLCLGMTKCLGPENRDEAWGEGSCWQEGKCKGRCRVWEKRDAAPSSKSVAWRLKSGALRQSSGYCSGRNWARWINSRITRRKPSCRSGLNPTISKNSQEQRG